MLIGIHDAEKEHFKCKTFPNLALMKISAYHKKQDDTVEWWDPSRNNEYDMVYSSKIFDFTQENSQLPPNTIKGGTGYDTKSVLPSYIDDQCPDYSIYPECDYAIGFLTRGCIRNCPWCVVPEKEGKLRPYREWHEVVRTDTDKLVLMDNNILACEHGIEQLQQLSQTQYRIDINQGMDARIVDKSTVELFKKLHWIRFIRFSCDTISQIPSIENVYRLFKECSAPVSRIFVYTIIRKNISEASERIEALKKLKSIHIYAQAEENLRKGVVPNAAQKEFANRYVYGKLYKKETWQEYCHRKNLKYTEE